MQPQTSFWLDVVLELYLLNVLWMGGWTGVRPPRDGQLRGVHSQALLACWRLQGCTAELL